MAFSFVICNQYTLKGARKVFVLKDIFELQLSNTPWHLHGIVGHQKEDLITRVQPSLCL